MGRQCIVIVGLIWALTSCDTGTNPLFTEAKQERSVKKAFQLLESQNPKDKADAHYLLGGFFKADSSNFDKALFHTSRSLKIYASLGYKDQVSRAHNNLGQLFRMFGHYRDAIKHYQEAIKTAPNEYLKNKRSIYLGAAYIELNELGTANKILLECLRYFKDTDYKFQLGELYIYLGNTHSAYGRLNNEGHHYNTAIEYYHKAYDNYDNDWNRATIIMNIGNNQMRLGNYEESLPLLRQSAGMHKDLGNTDHLAIALNDIGELYFRTNQYDSSLIYYTQSIELRHDKMSYELRKSYQDIKDSFVMAGMYQKADSVSNLYFALTEDILIEMRRMKILKDNLLMDTYDYIYEAEEKENELRLITIENWVLYLSILFGLSCIYYVIGKYYNRKVTGDSVTIDKSTWGYKSRKRY